MKKDTRPEARTEGPNIAAAFQEWLKNITYDEALGLHEQLSREREAEIVAAEAQRPLTEIESDTLRRIRDFFSIREGQVVIKSEDAERVNTAPIPWDYWKRRGLLFPKRSTRKSARTITTLPNGERAISTAVDYGEKVVTYRGFIPSDVSEKDLPKLGNMTDAIYQAAIFFQKAQIRETNSVAWPHVGKAELLRFMGHSEKEIAGGGKKFDLIDQSFQTLAYFVYDIRDKRTGQIEEVSHILSWRRDLKGRGFYFKLNDDHTRLIAALAQGKPDAGRYISLPRWMLQEAMAAEKKGIFEALISLAGMARPFPVLLKTIVREWAGLNESEVEKLRTENKISLLVSPIFKEAQERGLIRDWQYEKKSRSNENPLALKIIFSFHRKQRARPVDADLLAAMLEAWGQPGLFDDPAEAEKRLKKKRDMFTSAIRRLGAEAVRGIFDGTKDAEDGEAAFWRALDEER